jgi:NAD(P)-dependent dehydrogenase (short-subunit alcohol dehydrogenase family)
VDVADKVAVVAGGGSGMGKATAELLSEQGARVAILDLPTSKGPVTAKEIGATFHPCDVTDEPATEQALAAAMEAHGALHIAINTAGGGYSKRTINKDGPLPLADFRALIDRHLQPEPAPGLAHEQQRARRRGGARGDRQHLLDRRLRGPDRPGGLLRG